MKTSTSLRPAPAGLRTDRFENVRPIPVSIGTASTRVRLGELLEALSHALDMTEGQPVGHCVRACWIGLRIGREAGLSESELASLFYVLLLKDLGCSSNAARIC